MFDIHATLVANFCNYHTILYVFNSLICVEMANLYDLLSKVFARKSIFLGTSQRAWHRVMQIILKMQSEMAAFFNRDIFQ